MTTHPKIIIFNIAWMKQYKGETANDIPINGGSNKQKHEIFNFKPADNDGQFYAYVQLNSGIHLEHIGSDFDSGYIDGVTVVFTATNNDKKGKRIIGWYENARVYQGLFVNSSAHMPDKKNGKVEKFIAVSQRAVLLDENERWPITEFFQDTNVLASIQASRPVPQYYNLISKKRDNKYNTRRNEGMQHLLKKIHQYNGVKINANPPDSVVKKKKTGILTIDHLNGYERTLAENCLNNDLYEILKELFPPNNGYELTTEKTKASKGRTDIELRTLSGKKVYFEIKVSDKARDVIRRALGQLLEYSYYNSKDSANVLVIASTAKQEEEDKKYILLLQKRFKLPVFYQTIEISKKKKELNKIDFNLWKKYL